MSGTNIRVLKTRSSGFVAVLGRPGVQMAPSKPPDVFFFTTFEPKR